MENNCEVMTIEAVREMGGVDHLTDPEVQNIIVTSKELSLILYNLYVESEMKEKSI